MNVLIVDDEAPARQRLRTLLDQEPDVRVAAECSNGDEALDAIATHQPDAVFLDIQMPGRNGFDLIRDLPADSAPHIIFVTAYDEHAIRAFEVNALDYLLKPFSRERLRQSLDRLRAASTPDSHARLEQLLATLNPRPAPPRRLAVKDGARISLVPLAEVVCFLAEGNYVEVCVADGRRLLLRETMQSLETRLDPAVFFRASRSALINLSHLTEIVSEGKSGHLLKMANGEKIHLTVPLESLQKKLI